ncbi:MAG: LptE family protein [Pseudomonadota bacterium]
MKKYTFSLQRIFCLLRRVPQKIYEFFPREFFQDSRRVEQRLVICRFILITVLIISISACGYNFTGKRRTLNENIRTVSIPFFANKTFEPRLENHFTDALIEEFLKRGNLDVSKVDGSDATIIGAIKSFNEVPVSFDSNDRVLEYRVTVTLNISMKRNDNGLIIWKSSDISGYHEYLVSPNTATTYSNKIEAIKKIAEDMSENIHNMILEDF